MDSFPGGYESYFVHFFQFVRFVHSRVGYEASKSHSFWSNYSDLTRPHSKR